MGLTLGNNLTGTVSRTVSNANKQASTRGQSMTSGVKQDISSVNAFLSRSLEDNNAFLVALAKNTNYSSNMLATAKEYMHILSKTLEKGLQIINSSGQVSDAKLAVLEQGLSDVRSQISLLIDTASFDKKKVLTGDVRDLGLVVSTSSNDKLVLNITNFGEGRLFRSGVTKQLNTYFSEDPSRGRYYAVFRKQLDQDLIDNKNLLTESLYNTIDKYKLTHRQLATGLVDIRDNVGAQEDLEALSGVVESQFNTAAKDKLVSAWTNVFAKHPTFRNDPTGAAAASAAANAIVSGMELELDLADIRLNATAAATASDTSNLTGAVVAAMTNNFLNGGVATIGQAISSHPAMTLNAAGNKFEQVIGNDNNDLDTIIRLASEADAVAKANTDAAQAANAANIPGLAISAAQAGQRAAAYIINHGGTVISASIAAGKAAGAYIIANPPNLPAAANVALNAAAAGAAADAAARAAIIAAQAAGSPGFDAVEASIVAANAARAGPIYGAPVPGPAAAGAAAATFVINAGGNAAQAATAAGNAARLSAQGDADIRVRNSAFISSITASGAAAAAHVINAGGTKNQAIAEAIAAGINNPGVFWQVDKPSIAASAAAAFVIANGGVPAEAVEAAAEAAEAEAREIIAHPNPVTAHPNEQANLDNFVMGGEISVNAAIESAKSAARTTYASIFGDTGVGDVVEDIYMIYRNVPVGGYDNNKQGVKIENTNLSIIEKILDNRAAKDELMDRLKDDAVTDLQTEAGRAWSQNLFMSVLGIIRNDQASAHNQRANVIRIADALRTTNNVTEKAINSYKKTDYVLTAQQYAELLRVMVAAVTAMQAANKIPEAAQQLIAGLSR